MKEERMTLNLNKKHLLLIAVAFVFVAVLLPAYDFYAKHPPFIVGVASKNGASPPYEVLRLERDGYAYIWRTNNDVRLEVFQVTSSDDTDSLSYTYLINPEGRGFIVVRHRKYDLYGHIDESPVMSDITIYKSKAYPPNGFNIEYGISNARTQSRYPRTPLTYLNSILR